MPADETQATYQGHHSSLSLYSIPCLSPIRMCMQSRTGIKTCPRPQQRYGSIWWREPEVALVWVGWGQASEGTWRASPSAPPNAYLLPLQGRLGPERHLVKRKMKRKKGYSEEEKKADSSELHLRCGSVAIPNTSLLPFTLLWMLSHHAEREHHSSWSAHDPSRRHQRYHRSALWSLQWHIPSS